MKYGYARVSSDGQSVDAQVRQLTKAGCKKVFREVASGAKTERAQLRRHDRVEPVWGQKSDQQLVRGIGILYLTYILISKIGDGQKIRDFLERGIVGGRHTEERNRLANSLQRTLSVALAKTVSALHPSQQSVP
jgi:resolvase-like protein